MYIYIYIYVFFFFPFGSTGLIQTLASLKISLVRPESDYFHAFLRLTCSPHLMRNWVWNISQL